MTRKSWVQCPVTLKLIPKEEYAPGGHNGPFVMGDIQPYKSMITGEMITSRSQHRVHLRQHNCIEVGNEKIGPRKDIPLDRERLKRTIGEVMSAKGY